MSVNFNMPVSPDVYYPFGVPNAQETTALKEGKETKVLETYKQTVLSCLNNLNHLLPVLNLIVVTYALPSNEIEYVELKRDKIKEVVLNPVKYWSFQTVELN